MRTGTTGAQPTDQWIFIGGQLLLSAQHPHSGSGITGAFLPSRSIPLDHNPTGSVGLAPSHSFRSGSLTQATLRIPPN